MLLLGGVARILPLGHGVLCQEVRFDLGHGILVIGLGGAAGNGGTGDVLGFGKEGSGWGNASEVILGKVNWKEGFLGLMFKQARNLPTLLPADVKRIDPLGIGVNPAVLKIFQAYPLPNATPSDAYNTNNYKYYYSCCNRK